MGRPVDQPKAEATRLGSYEIVRKLARGGMAELFLARTIGPEGFEKLVVLKKILPNHAENPKFVRLFLDEAKLVATLDHPHIAHVYDMGKVDGNYFFTMEYVHGQDVRSTLRRTSRLDKIFPIDHAVQIARNIAAALHYAHERKQPNGALLDIIHRDVSPSNILISYDGAVKLVDFGVAKAATSTVKTRTGTLKGKISYMSPEQAKGSPIDRRSDIFSLGIVLWEMVTTQRLFRSDNDLATIQMIINSQVEAPSKHNPEISPELDRVVLKALSNKLDDRYQTAEQLQLDLEELAREQKLKQSTVALRAYMHDLFSAEINAWTVAQAKGETLTDYLLNPSGEHLTTPVSGSEIDFISEDDEDYDEEDIDSEQATALPSISGMATTQISVPPPPRNSTDAPLRVVESMPQQSIVVMDQTPPPRPPATPPATPPLPMHIEAHTPRPADQSFPIAPMEWRQSGPIETMPGLHDDRRKKVLITGSIAFAVIVLFLVVFAGHPPNAASKVAPPAPKIDPKAEGATPVEQPEQPTQVDMPSTGSDTAAGSATPTDQAEEEQPEETGSADNAETAQKPTTTKPTTTKPTTTKPTTSSTKPTTTKPTTSSTKPTTTKPTTTKPTTTKPTTTRPGTGSGSAKPKPRGGNPDDPLPPT